MDVQTVRVSALFFFAILLLVSACAPKQPGLGREPTAIGEAPGADPEVADALARGDLEAAALLLQQRAADAPVEDRQRLLLRAAELRLDLGQAASARDLIARLDEALLPSDGRYRKNLLEVRLLLADGSPAAAETMLSSLPPPSAEVRTSWLKARADVAEATGKPLDAAQALVELDQATPAQQAGQQNLRRIWALLSDVPMEVLRARMPPPPDQMGAWLELAFLVRSHRLEPDTLESVVYQWRQRYPDHPANLGLADELIAHYRDMARAPQQIALLLPLTGDLSAQARAVLDGFMAAYYAAEGDKPRIKVYDVGGDPGRTLSAYQEAVESGSDYVVGPLRKEALIMLASAAQLSTPVLALNTLPGEAQDIEGMVQFALAPEDDASAAADYAAAQGMKRALVMVPGGDWGERVAKAFADTFERRGGIVLETVSYEAEGTDFSPSITALLNLDASGRRARQLRGVLRRNIQAEPQRRQDVDIIFVGAFPRAARLIRPQLRFFDAIDVPVIATSHAYSGFASQADQDLDGVHIVDMPWMLRDGAGQDTLSRTALQQLREPAMQNPRLYAFGIDAYGLVQQLPFLRQSETETMEGRTGILSLDSQGRIHRRLAPARFRGPQATAVGEVGETFGFRPGDNAAATW